jgi:excisionase family DNA binding protein
MNNIFVDSIFSDVIMTPKQVARYLQVSPRTVYSRCEQLGGLRIGRTLRFRKEIIDALFRKEEKKWKGVVKRGKERFTHLFQTKTEAKTWEVEKLKELESPKPEKTEADIDLLTVSNEYLDFCKRRFSSITYGEKRKLCADILKKWGNVNVNDVTPTMVMKHLEDRAHKVSNNAWNRDRKNLLAMFNWFRKIRGINHNPVINIERLPEERKIEYIPPAKDIYKVMLACSGQDRIILHCYYFTFARRGKIFNWTWEDINFEKQWYRL